jgi:hypothetical protein
MARAVWATVTLHSWPGSEGSTLRGNAAQNGRVPPCLLGLRAAVGGTASAMTILEMLGGVFNEERRLLQRADCRPQRMLDPFGRASDQALD